MEPSVENLRVFVEVARAGTMNGAAELLFIDASSVGRRLTSLEETLGVTLFVRTNRGAVLTPAGRELLVRAQHIIAQVHRLSEYAQNLADGAEGVVSIACYPVHIERFLGRVMGEFRRRNPTLRIDLTRVRDDRRRDSGHSLFTELLDGDVDLAMGPPHTHRGTRGFKIYDARIRAIFESTDARRHLKSVPIDELRSETLLLAPPKYFSREKIANAARHAGFDLQVEAESSSPTALAELGRQGLGVPLLPDDYAVVRPPEFPYPVLTDDKGNEILTPVWLQWKKDEELPVSAQYFVELARELTPIEEP